MFAHAGLRVMFRNFHPANRCSGEKPEGDQQLYTMTLNDTLGPQMYKALYRWALLHLHVHRVVANVQYIEVW